MTPEGNVALIASDAQGHRARGIRPGTKLAKLRPRAKRIGHGLWVARTKKKAKKSRKAKTRVVYLVRHKRVRTVALAGSQVRGRRALRQYMALVPTTGMKARRSLAVKSTSAHLTDRNAAPLVQQQDPHRFELFCSIGL